MARERHVWPSLSGRGVVTLSDAFRTWVVENAAAGVATSDLVAELVRGGVPRRIAEREVAAIVVSPAVTGARALAKRATRAEMLLDLRSRLLRESSFTVERRTMPPSDELFARYFAGNRPAVFTDATEGWPARDWTPERIVEIVGDVEMEIASHRDDDATPDRNLDAHREKTTLAEYVRRIRAAGETNDIYTVANNKNMDRPAFKKLLADIRVDEAIFDPARLDGGFSFWLGPAGTVTPLHHDTTNVFFHQLHGRKRFLLIAPEETSLLDHATGFYVNLDPEADPLPPELEGVPIHTVELAAGESLFIPVGWWHHVRALDVSISFSQLHFRRPNSFEEYRPGF